MKNLKLIFLLLLTRFALAQNNIIPAPVSYVKSTGDFVLDKSVIITNQFPSTENLFEEFRKELNLSKSGSKHITIVKSNKILNEEGYRLEVKPSQITITAKNPGGVFYAFQSLKQMIGPNNKIAACIIEDYPRFKWRGLMLDVSRHFFTVAEVKSYIDKMAEFKFNVLHWHLTDDEGWRIEIKSLPKLTEIGAWRVERQGRFGSNRAYPKEGEKATYGGFYTQTQVKDIVKYAAEKNISIVPEIDMPGHSMAALAAYPELATKNTPKFVNPGSKFAEWYGDGKFEMLIENTLNPSDENVYAFIDKVMTEVAQLFPAEYIHLGGDECYHGFWEKDTNVQAFMKANQLKDTHELQSYFVKRVQKIISSKGKKAMGWDEILEGGLADNAAVMSWRGMKGGIEAAKLGHPVVMSPTTFAYLDYCQGDKSLENPIYADLSLKKTYEFVPVPDGVDPKMILGAQANLWTEVIPTLQYAFYMTYPRAFATAETAWSPKESKNWINFAQRTEKQFSKFEKSNTSICTALYEPIVKVKNENDQLTVDLSCDFPDLEIYYTLDNTYPVKFGKKYEKTLVVPPGDLSLRCQSFKNGEAVGRMLQISRADLLERAKK